MSEGPEWLKQQRYDYQHGKADFMTSWDYHRGRGASWAEYSKIGEANYRSQLEKQKYDAHAARCYQTECNQGWHQKKKKH